jgi:hypothetical protein
LKRCSGCHELKPFEAFHKDKHQPDGHASRCKECRKISEREQRIRNREHRLRYQTEWDKQHPGAKAAYARKSWRNYSPERIKDIMLRTRYKLTYVERQALEQQQQGRCKICGKPTEKLVVDHKHDESGKVRGLLCIRCNSGIGHFLENEAILVAAIAYLRLDGDYNATHYRLTFDLHIERIET